MAGNSEKKFTMKFAADLDSTFGKTFGKINQELEKLKNVEKNIKGFEKAAVSTKGFAMKLAGVKSQYSEITKQVAEFGEVTEKNSKKYNSLLAKQSKLKARMAIFNSEMIKSAANTKEQAQQLMKLGLTTKNYNAQLAKVEQTMKRLRAEKTGMSIGQAHVGKLKSMIGNGLKTIATVGAGAIAGGAAMGGGLAYNSAQHFISFEKQMKKVQAISGATSEEYRKLEASAIRMGATTVFTAEEAAAGMEKFALAGFKTNDIIEVMPSVLSLTAASGEDLAMVADMISDNMVPFKLGVKDTARFADVLANTMSRTNVNVGMIGETLKYAGASAGTLGLSIEETAAAIGMMGDQAVKSGMAGTALNSAFGRLSNKDIQEKLKKVGIAVKDSKGNFLGLSNVVSQFQKHTSKMGGVDKNAFLMEIFGEQGYKAMSMLMTGQKEFNGQVLTGVDALKALTAENENSAGKAKKMQDTMMEGAQGAIEYLTSAWDGLRIIIGKLVANDTVVGWIKNTTKYIEELAAVLSGDLTSDPINMFFQSIIKSLNKFKTDFTTAIKPVTDAVKNMFPEDMSGADLFAAFLQGVTDNLRSLSPILAVVVQLFGMLAKVVMFIGPDNLVVLATLWLTLTKVTAVIVELKTAIKTAGTVMGWFKGIITSLGGPIALIIAGLIYIAYYLEKNGGLWNNLKAIAEATINFILALFQTFISAILSWFGLLSSVLEGLVEGFQNWDSNLSIGENLLNVIKSVIDKIKENFIKLFTSIIDGFVKVWDSIKNIPFIKKLFGTEVAVSEAEQVNKVVNSEEVNQVVNAAEESKGELLNNLNQTDVKNMSTTTTNNQASAQSYNIEVKPTIVVQGSVTQENVNDITKLVADEVKKVLKELGINEKRVSYA